jgi:hypothetical protein
MTISRAAILPSGSLILASRADVPKGAIMGSGILVIELSADGKLAVKKKTGGFSDSEWTRK